MPKSRTGKLIKNVTIGALSELVKLACGLILPRLILSNFGSSYNGIVQSVTQFLSCIALMKTGIGGATKAALFKPLAEKNSLEISEVLASTERFMRKIAMIFAIFTLCFACIYPIFISREFDWLFSFSLIIIISISTFAEYYFGFTYHMLIDADQKGYIYSYLSILAIILNTIVSVILINNNCSIHVVKLGSALVNVITPIYLYIYCHKKYKLVKIDNPSMSKIPQRWDAFIHEIASFVNDNTDIMILTIFTNLLEVSVYTVYHYVIVNLKKIVITFASSFGVTFGDMYAKNEIELMKKNLKVYELVTYSLATIMYSVAIAMIVPFAVLYTKGVNDVNYSRMDFAIIICLAGLFDCFRFPYKQIINCTGHYKQTKKIAILEAIINLTTSIIMVIKFGLVGVAIGTLATMAFGAISYSAYVSKNIINRNTYETYKRMVLALITVVIIVELSKIIMSNSIPNYYIWATNGFLMTIIAIIITAMISFVFYKDEIIYSISKIKKIIFKR